MLQAEIDRVSHVLADMNEQSRVIAAVNGFVWATREHYAAMAICELGVVMLKLIDAVPEQNIRKRVAKTLRDVAVMLDEGTTPKVVN